MIELAVELALEGAELAAKAVKKINELIHKTDNQINHLKSGDETLAVPAQARTASVLNTIRNAEVPANHGYSA